MLTVEGYSPISDYGLIGDTVSASLINRQAGIDWLCWPRFDSAAVFLALLDRDRGGRVEITTHDGKPLEALGRRYRVGTMILETRIGTEDGELTVVDFMPVRLRPGVVENDDTDLLTDNRIVRKIRCDRGSVRCKLTIWPTFDYANPQLPPARIGVLGSHSVNPPVRMHPASGEQRMGHFYVEAEREICLDLEQGKVWIDIDLTAGQETWVALTEGEYGRVLPLKSSNDITRLFDETEQYWTDWSTKCGNFGEFHDIICRSLLTLKALTYSPTGAIVAAPTMGLPESWDGNRNYDYRYTWIRDASFTVRAFLTAGYLREARAFLRFLEYAQTEHGRMMPVMLNLDGVLPPNLSRDLSHLDGYRGVHPLGTGNEAQKQIQHDAWGESLNALYAYYEMTGRVPPEGPRGTRTLGEMVGNIATAAATYWRWPDRGIWENRDGDQHFFHSKVMCWLALKRAVDLAKPLKLDPHDVQSWAETAEKVREDFLTHGWNESRQAYTQAYDSDTLDAAVLRTAIFGAIDMKEPRGKATLQTIQAELASQHNPDLLYRYRVPDGMRGREGCFLSCSYWLMACMGLSGKVEEGKAMFRRLIGTANDLGLMSEEIDPRDGRMMGNFPQAFTHMCVVIGALRLEDGFASKRPEASQPAR